MSEAKRIVLTMLLSALAACASQAPTSKPAAPQPAIALPESKTSATPTRFDGPGHDYANAVHFAGVNNPLAFSQKQQEWLWLHYRDWKKQGQALREKNGQRYDEVTLINKRGETRVIYFRMPKGQ